jgi:eukaryotic-like serine/threonine-protein kinase
VEADRNLLAGVLALQADLITPTQLADACAAWKSCTAASVAGYLAGRGWITPADRARLDRLVGRHLDGEGRTSQPQAATDDAWQSWVSGSGEAWQQAATALMPAGGKSSPLPYVAPTRERYELRRLHATGGLGQVWLARDAHLGRDVALKELRPDRAADPRIRDWFLKEARVTGQLEHPGVVPVHELARRPGDGQPFYTMRFVQGRTLAEAAAEFHRQRQRGGAGRLGLLALLNAFAAVCHAIAYAHSRGVLHRDLKPANVVLGDFGEVVVLDWGLAKLLGADDAATPLVLDQDGPPPETLPGQVLGTPSYMAPEQAAGRHDQIDARTDVYGLGAILYELLTGRPPFVGANTGQVLRRVREEEPAPPRAAWPDVPVALVAVCRKALARRPEDRYAAAADLARDVQSWLGDDPVSAYREQLPARLGRAARRHKPLVAGAVGLLAAAAVALAVGNVLVGRQRARAEANYQTARAAVDRYFVQVSEHRLLHEPGLQPLRRELLRTAVEFYGQLAEERGDDSDARADLGRACLNLAGITEEIAAAPEAGAPAERARAIFDELARAHPQRPDYLAGLADCHFDLGILAYGADRLDEAEAAYRTALAIREQLARDHPSEPGYQSDVAHSYQKVAVVCRATNRPAESAEAYAKALECFALLTRDHPEQVKYRNDLAACHKSLGILCRSVGRLEEARSAYREALAVAARLASDYPAVAEYRNNLAQLHTNLGNVHRERRQFAEARAAYEAALPLLERLTRDHPDVADYQATLAATLFNLGNVHVDVRNPTPAEASYRGAITLWERLVRHDPTVPARRRHLAVAYATLARLYEGVGRVVEARELGKKARELHRP